MRPEEQPEDRQNTPRTERTAQKKAKRERRSTHDVQVRALYAERRRDVVYELWGCVLAFVHASGLVWCMYKHVSDVRAYPYQRRRCATQGAECAAQRVEYASVRV